MPEDKKKESFTFSDKIKESKQSAPKSFVNRLSSKIGSDGRPRQTLFERTKRDAPFFIAAIVALLLLPFLYKYSGQVNEDASVVTPGYEDAILNPDRSGFDFTGDPEGQISQLAGRDSMDLIVGFGKKKDEESDESLDELYRSGLSDEAAAASSYSRDDMDEEVNNTNIYKYRKNAPRQTRAAFRRAATKINNLKGAGLNGRGGGVNIQPWGGGLKNAAKKVGAERPRTAPKPVSLQPLTAAGKPSRSSFGQGAAAEARRSKDAMSKHNPLQALMDAQMRPVEPHKIGGIGGGNFGGPGGGNGNLQRAFAFNGKEPWWWDLMKTRSQMEWERHFNRKWKYIDALDDIILGLARCLITGNSDGDPDTFIGTGGGSVTKAPTCCGKKKNKIAGLIKQQTGLDFGKEGCNNYKTMVELAGGKCPGGWDEGHGGGEARLGFFGARWACLGGLAGKYTAGDLALNEMSDCYDLVNKHYQVNPSGQARKWHTYVYIVARNYLPETSKAKLDEKAPRGYLCTDEDFLGIGKRASSGVQANGLNKEFDGKESGDERYRKTSSRRLNKERNLTEDMYERNPEDINNGCVIYLQKGDTLNWKNFETTTIDRFRSLLRKQGLRAGEDIEVLARNAFNQLDLMFVESFSADSKLGGVWLDGPRNRDAVQLPMTYWRFHDAYIRHKRTATNEDYSTSRSNVDKRRYRVEGADYIMGDRCWFKMASINCEDVDGTGAFPTATVTFKQGYKGGQALNLAEEQKKIGVQAKYVPLNANEKTRTLSQDMHNPVVGANGYTLEYTFTNPLRHEGAEKEGDPLRGSIFWTLIREGEVIDTAECRINLTGDGAAPVVEQKRCPKGKDTNEECCEEFDRMDPAHSYIWINGKCEMEVTPDPDGGQHTVFAPRIGWVPNRPDDRQPVEGDGNQNTFGPGMLGGQCSELYGFMMDSQKATEFVNAVRDTYNEKHPNLPIEFSRQYPMDSEFIDALNIINQINPSAVVSVAAVCELGRDFVRMSKDPHAGNRTVTDMEGTKQEPMVYRNELGAFLAYVHEDSILYPEANIRIKGRDYCDWRFQPEHMEDGGLCASGQGPKMGKAYQHNNYNGVKDASLGTALLRAFNASRTPVMKRHPLAPLVEGKTIPHACGNCKNLGGKNRVAEYNSYAGFAGLLHEEDPSNNDKGVACEAFLGNRRNAKMTVAQALEYVKGVCEAGLDYKPHGVGAVGYSANQRPTKRGDKSGTNEKTGQGKN